MCTILGLFNNPLAGDDESSLLHRDNFLEHVQMEVSQKEKIFLIFFVPFLNADLVLNIFEEKMTLIPDVFLNFQTPKNEDR